MWDVQYNSQHNPLWNLFTRHTPVGNLPLYVFRVRPMSTFHLSIQKEMARHVGSRIASSRSPSGFSFGGKHRESDIHSMIETHTRAHSFVLLPQIRRALDSPSRIKVDSHYTARIVTFRQRHRHRHDKTLKHAF